MSPQFERFVKACREMVWILEDLKSHTDPEIFESSREAELLEGLKENLDLYDERTR